MFSGSLIFTGGRIKQAEAFPGFPPVDLGGGFIHGSDNSIQTLAKENGWKVQKVHDLIITLLL